LFPADNYKVFWHVNRFLRAPWKNADGSWMLPIDNGPRGVIGVVGPPGGVLEGMAMLGIACYWYTAEMHIEEFMMYVDPRFRTKGHAKELIRWQKNQCDINRMALVTGVLSNHRTAAKCRLLGREYNKAGEFFTWNAEFVADELSGPGRVSPGEEHKNGRRR
jgi:GNAT superfamily N-acetyltransferase